MAPASDGSLWIAYSDGLSRMRDGQVRRYTTRDGLSSNRILSVAEDRNGVIWVETNAGIDRLAEDRFTSVETAQNAFSGEGRFGFGKDRLENLFAFALWNGTFHVQGKRSSK
jgi:ligand-binding sensor domain-containing protein